MTGRLWQRVRNWPTRRRVGLAVGFVLAGGLWYALVPSWWSVALIATAVVSFIVVDRSCRLRKLIETVLPEQFSAYRPLFIALFALGALLIYTQARHYGHVESPPQYFTAPTVEFGAPHAAPTGSPAPRRKRAKSGSGSARVSNASQTRTKKPTTYYYTMTIDPKNCAKTVLVTVRLFIQPESVPVGRSIKWMNVGRVFLSVSDQHAQGDKSTIHDVSVPRRSEHGARENGLVVIPDHQKIFRSKGQFAHYLQPGTIISADAGRWPMSDKTPIVFRFHADWTQDRGVGSCYVVLPTGQKYAGDPEQWAQPVASYVKVVPGAHQPRGTVILSASSSEPYDPLIPQWMCPLKPHHPKDCSGYAVYAKAGETDKASDGVFKFAAMLGVCLAIVVELIIQPFCERRRS